MEFRIEERNSVSEANDEEEGPDEAPVAVAVAIMVEVMVEVTVRDSAVGKDERTSVQR